MQDSGAEKATWTYYNPTRVLAGADSLHEIMNMHTNAQTFTIVIGSSSAKDHGYLDRVHGALSGKAVSIYSGIPPEPSQTDAERLKSYLAADKPNVVVAL